MESSKEQLNTETTSTTLKSSSLGKKRLAVIGIICLVLAAVIIGLAVGLSDSGDDIANAPLSVRIKRAEEILDKYPLVDG